jgi:hypothetical protein
MVAAPGNARAGIVVRDDNKKVTQVRPGSPSESTYPLKGLKIMSSNYIDRGETTARREGAIAKTSTSVPTNPHLEEFFSRVDPARARLIFAVDATASRQPTWDTAAHLQSQMFATVAAIGGLDVQLVYYRGHEECTKSRWLSDPKALAAAMTSVDCRAGHTQIKKVLAHARKENAREKVAALILVSDACEELPSDLYAEASELGVPVFAFQEGDSEGVAEIYQKIARMTDGAFCQFDSDAAQRLADLLKAVAAFAAGGVKALAAQQSAPAKLLLTQIRK